MNSPPVVLVTGASSGIGQVCAQHLHKNGYRVYGTSRNAPWPARHLSSGVDSSDSFIALPLEVTQELSVQRAIAAIWEWEGRLDVVVNNAGYGTAGSVENTSMEEARAQLEVNFFGMLRICQTVLPLMREQNSGYIINISSLAGLIGIPFQGLYSASKYAVEGLTEALRMEVQSYGIRVVLIEPGDFCTGFTAHRQKGQATLCSVYKEAFCRALRVMEKDEMNGPAPEKIAFLLERIIKNPHPRLRYRVGPIAEACTVILKKVLPSKIFERAIMKNYSLL